MRANRGAAPASAANGGASFAALADTPAGHAGQAGRLVAVDAEEDGLLFALDLVRALAANGLVARTGPDATAARTLQSTAGRVTVTDGDGVAGNPTISLPDDVSIAGLELTAGGSVTTGIRQAAASTPAVYANGSEVVRFSQANGMGCLLNLGAGTNAPADRLHLLRSSTTACAPTPSPPCPIRAPTRTASSWSPTTRTAPSPPSPTAPPGAGSTIAPWWRWPKGAVASPVPRTAVRPG